MSIEGNINKKARSVTFDVMKCIGIILVIIGHLKEYSPAFSFIYSFHMPLFFIIGGYFFHSKPTSVSLKSDIKRLIYPYIITATALILINFIFSFFQKWSWISVKYWIYAALYGSGYNVNPILLSNRPDIGAIWFLLAMSWCKNAFNLIYKRTKYWLIFTWLVAISATIIEHKLINLPFSFLPGLSAMSFYSVGVLIKQKDGFLSINPFIWVIAIIVWIISFLSPDIIAMVRCDYPNFVVNFIGACGATYFVYLVSDLIATSNSEITKLIAWGGAKQPDVSMHSFFRYVCTNKSSN